MDDDSTLMTDESDSFSERPLASALSGCFYAAFVIALSVGMLLTNALLCLTIYSIMPEFGPPELNQRVGQFFYFLAPVLLMVLEWHLIDRVRRMLRPESL
ncbi:MAG: hypothetical protein KDB22_11150 [Planctomycetales bacterium]|nr:hypothetical protein [Planctomycetales bacterium]